ncbi:MAG: HDOD domain-containing protein [Candidatus Marinarcus sp.]|uniref:HDOD domain-containing protein n=1 Tax=Candidatus Marinarcus sp. TaxID=3100987 RepID=UPI003B003BB2
MKNNLLYEKIDALPPLPRTILELEEFKRTPDKQPEVLLDIIRQDPLVVATILKIANSAMFGFKSSVETPNRAINLLGINFTLSIAFSTSIKNAIKTDLLAYGVNSNDFFEITNMSSTLLSSWVSQFDPYLKDELLLPTFLQETGKFLISDLIMEQNQKENFLNDLQTSEDIASVERKYLSTTTSEVTACIFRRWNLHEKLINSIEFVDNIQTCPHEHITDSKILNIIKTICNIEDPLSQASIFQGLEKAKSFGFDTIQLEEAIKQVQTKINRQKELT